MPPPYFRETAKKAERTIQVAIRRALQGAQFMATTPALLAVYVIEMPANGGVG